MDCPGEIMVIAQHNIVSSNTTPRLLSTCQLLWFLVNVLARAGQGLAITPLEITTVAFIICTLGTAFCWRHKPMDVEVPLEIETSTSIDQILIEAGPEACQPYRRTPLEFIDREEWIATQLWTYYVNILRQIRFVHTRPKIRPIQRFSSFDFPKLSPALTGMAVFMTVLYCAMFLIPWNFHFPTPTERFLWRLMTGLQMALGCTGALFEQFILAFQWSKNLSTRATFRVSKKSPNGTLPTTNTLSEEKHLEKRSWFQRARSFVNRPINNCPDKDPAMNVWFHSMVFTTPICAGYVICRWFVLAEDIVGLRSLPPSAFKTVEWWDYLPHL